MYQSYSENNGTLLITGGTGSFGNAVLRRFLDTDIKEIRIFRRDEKISNKLFYSTDKKRKRENENFNNYYLL
jgi:UDP-glucose 4-epimerase